MAPRYKENPFGSKLDRFRKKSPKSNEKPIMTDQIIREENLKRDLYEHTGIGKKSLEQRERFRIQDRIAKRPAKEANKIPTVSENTSYTVQKINLEKNPTK